jgi:transcriptional regulator with XRE-family HTH domain
MAGETPKRERSRAAPRQEGESLRRWRRRLRLEALCDEADGVVELAERTGTPRTHVSALLAGRRGIGDELAQKMEAAFDKPAGWMDEGVDEQPAPPTSLQTALVVVARRIAELSKLDRRQVAALLPLLAEEPESRADTCKAIMKLIQPGESFDYALTWEESAREVAAELGNTSIPARQFIELADENHGKSVRLQAVVRKTGTG